MMGISLFINGIKAFLFINFLYLLSFGFTAIATSPSIVSGLVVATTILPKSVLYEISHILPCSSLETTSKSERAVCNLTSQFASLKPLYISPSSYKVQKTSITASLKSSSIVNFSLFQSREAPNLRSCFVIVVPDSFFHFQISFSNFFLPKDSFVFPSFSRFLSTTI